MKNYQKVFFIIILIAAFAIPCLPFTAAAEDSDKTKVEAPPHCPGTLISDNDKCLQCHVMVNIDGKMRFITKEVPLDAAYDDKPYKLEIVKDRNGSLCGYYQMEEIKGEPLKDIAYYLRRHPELKKLVIELFSPGGSVMEAWRIAGIIGEMRADGVTVETKCNGFAASAAFIVLVSGDIGHRFVNPHAELMVHKLWTFAMFSIDDPDTSEDKAAVMRHFQDNINNYILSRTKLDKKMLEEKIFKRDWWMTGEEAIKYGVADGFTSNPKS